MRALPECMNSGIGSSCAMHAQLLANDLGESSLDSILNCVAARLTLPTRERRAVISDDKLEPSVAVGNRRR
jgi:hypothetical protein